MPQPKTKRPIQRVNPNILIYFTVIDDLVLPAPDKTLIKEKVLEQFLQRNESLVLEEEEEVPDQ